MTGFAKFITAIVALRLSGRKGPCPRCHGLRRFLFGVAVGLFIGACLWTGG